MGFPDLCTRLPQGKEDYPPLILVGGWAYHSEKYDFVSWDDDIPNIWKNKTCKKYSKPPTSHIESYDLLTWDETSCSEETSLHNAGFQHVVDNHGWLETSTFLDFQHF